MKRLTLCVVLLLSCSCQAHSHAKCNGALIEGMQMNGERIPRKPVAIIGVLLLGACGCRRAPDGAGSDTVVEELNRIRPVAVRYGCEDRIEKVLAMRTDNVTDSQPVLLIGVVSEDPGLMPTTVWLCLYDEEVDILGLGIQERYVGADGESAMLVEEYPVFMHRPASGSYDYRGLPLHIRDAGQRKDMALWDRYVAGEGIETGRAKSRAEYYRETLPPIWMSIPDPNTVDVHLYLYDRAGNKSELVRPARAGQKQGPSK